MGVIIDANEISMTKSLDVKDENNSIIGELRSACLSPHFNKEKGIDMINKTEGISKEKIVRITPVNLCDIDISEVSCGL